MAMNIFPPSTTVHAGDVVQLPFYCSEPGTVVVTSSDETVATVAGSVVVAGSRMWRNGLKHGQYLAREGASTASRTQQTFLFRVRKKDITYTPAAAAYAPNRQYLIQNYRTDAVRRVNYGIQLCSQNISISGTVGHQIFVAVIFSVLPTQVETYFISAGYYINDITNDDYIRFAVVLNSGANKIYVGSTSRVTNSTLAQSGTMGGMEWLVQQGTCEWAKYDGILSDSVLSAFLENNIWANSPYISILGGHEINSNSPVFWDSAGVLDITNTNVTYLPPAAASGDYTDTVPVVPYTYIPVSALQPGTTTITARRRRQGVPDRTPPLPDAELYETTTYTLTVTDALQNEQNFAQLMIYADRDGTALITMDNPIINFPASVAVNEGKNQVAGEIIGSGTCNVTVTLNGVTDTTQFVISAIPLNLNIGPETTLDYEGLPVTFKLVASCDHVDKTVNISTTGVGITTPPTVYLNGTPVEFEVTVNGFGEYSVTGEVDGETSTAFIHSINDTIRLYLEADRDIHTKDLPITFNMRVFCSRDGEVTLSSTGAGVTIPDTVTVVDREATFPVTISAEGVKIISAVYDTAYAECTLLVSEEAFLISLGEDRHIYYQGNDITFTKTVYCNKDGVVTLSQTGEAVDIPASVTVINGTAEFDVTVHGAGVTIISAIHEDEPLVDTECQISVSEIPIVLSLGADRVFEDVLSSVTFTMNVFCNRDGICSLSSDHAVVPATVTVTGGIGTFDVTCDEDSVITASFGTATDVCNVILNLPDAHVYIGPDVVITEPNITLQLATIASRPGTGTIAVAPTSGLSFPSTVTFAIDSLEQQIEGTLTELGDYVVTLSMDGANDSCSVAVSTGRHCLLVGTITDVSGRPVRLAAVNFKTVPVVQALYSSVLSTGTKTAYTNRDGEFAIRLLRGSRLIASCEKTGYRKQITIPDQAEVDLKDL